MKIIVTGVAGFIGSNLADRLLQEGHRVIGIDNLSYGVKEQIPAGVEFHKFDIREKEMYPLYEGADFVFHMAAKNSIIDCQNDPVGTADNNVMGSANVFEASRRGGIKKVIYAETSALYEGASTLPTPETDVVPHTFYAVSKLCEGYFAEAYRRFYNLRSTALRYFNVYGPRQDYRRTIPPVMSAFIIKLLRNERSVIYGDGSKRRDFIHVDDINDFHLMCMKDERTDNSVFNLGSGKSYSMLDTYQTIRDIIGSSIEPEFKPDQPGEAQENLADILRAKKIGWVPKTDMRQGLKNMVEYIKNEIAKGNID